MLLMGGSPSFYRSLTLHIKFSKQACLNLPVHARVSQAPPYVPRVSLEHTAPQVRDLA